METRPLITGAALLYVVLALADLLSKELGWNVYVHNVGILVGCVFCDLFLRMDWKGSLAD